MTLTAFKANLPNALPDNTVGSVEVADVRNQLLALAEEVEDGAQIASIYEGEDNTNKFTDAEKAKLLAVALTPQQFGAPVNGSDSDSAAVNAMLAAVGSRGAPIFFPPGHYVLDASDVDLFNKSFLVWGVPSGQQGYGSRLVMGQNRSIRTANTSGTKISDLRIEGNASTTVGAILEVGKHGQANGTSNIVLDNLQLIGGYRGLWLQKSANTTIVGSRIVSQTGPEAFLAGGSTDTAEYQVDGVTCFHTVIGPASTTDCVSISGPARSLSFVSCPVLFGDIGYAIKNDIGSATGPKFVYITGGKGLENQQGRCFSITAGDVIMIGDVYASNDGADDILYMGPSLTGRVTCNNVHFRGAGRNAVRHLNGRLNLSNSSLTNNKTSEPIIYSANTVAQPYRVVNNTIGDDIDGSNSSETGYQNDAPSALGYVEGNQFPGLTTPYAGTTGKTTAGAP